MYTNKPGCHARDLATPVYGPDVLLVCVLIDCYCLLRETWRVGELCMVNSTSTMHGKQETLPQSES